MSAKPQRHSRPQCWRDSDLDFQMLRVSQHVQVDSFMRRYTKFMKHVCEGTNILDVFQAQPKNLHRQDENRTTTSEPV